MTPLRLVGDLPVAESEDVVLAIPGTLELEAEAERVPKAVGEVVLAIEPLFKNDPGRSPNFGNANWKSLPLLL